MKVVADAADLKTWIGRDPCVANCSFLLKNNNSPHTRKVPGRKGMSYTEEDWVDDDATSHRGPNE